jgi:hypothetical protein
MRLVNVQIATAISVGRMALRIQRDERDWLKQAIERGRRDIRRMLCQVAK